MKKDKHHCDCKTDEATYLLRNTNTSVINLPSVIWKEAGWNINDKVNVLLCGEYTAKGICTHYTVTIERVEDYENCGV